MKLHGIDVAIVLGYLLCVSLIGVLLSRRASRSLNSYLLGGKELPWYLLGLSNASGMFDISGTMWLVTIMFVYGLKSVWLPWLWPTFNQIVLMVFLSAWLRRSNVTTGAQWIGTRFGTGLGAQLSHAIVVIFAIVGCLGFMAYGFIGLGKFIQIFIPWETISPYVPFDVPAHYVPHVYGIAFTIVAVFYTVLGGMTSIVLADLVQYVIMTVAAVVIAGIAMHELSLHQLAVPAGWSNPFFGWNLGLDWTGIVDEVNDKITSDQFSWFTIIMMLMLFKGIGASAAGPAPNYDMQKILATRSPREAAMMSGFVSVVLMPVRYLMVVGFAVLGLLYFNRLNLMVSTPTGPKIDFEQILPSAIHEFVPVGLLGCLLAGLLAAFLGTFAGTLNAAQAYIVNDLYLKYIRPNAGNRQTTLISYATGIVIVVVSILLGVLAENVNSLLQWIVSGLYGGYVASNLLKWYWWRFNGHGYFWGMVAGLVPALIFPLIFKGTLALYYFPVLFVLSLAGCIIGTYASEPTDEKTLISFYRNVRPWGFWGPVHKKVIALYPDFQENRSFGRDMSNVVVGTIWQTALVLLPMYVVLLNWAAAAVVVAIIVATSWFLKKNWYDLLDREAVAVPVRPQAAGGALGTVTD
ncbi:MAG: sodium:solute symporter [Planctomycetes bacterium RBG_13_60_9]|nr:MAG: sodium:solute symporter [Planctomycetes bacterium RBG_13_60_9]